MQIKATIIEISDAVQVSATFKKREFAVEYDEKNEGRYIEFVKFEAIQEKCELLDSINVGDVVEIDFNLKGRKWTNPQGEVKYFNTLQAWRIAPEQSHQQAPAPYQQQAPAGFPQAPTPAAAAPKPASASVTPAPDFQSGLDEDVPF